MDGLLYVSVSFAKGVTPHINRSIIGFRVLVVRWCMPTS